MHRRKAKVLRLGVALLAAGFCTLPLTSIGAQISVVPVVPAPITAPCILPVDPVPSGSSGTPGDPFPALDHRFVHSSVGLQGLRAKVKYAGGLLHLPSAVPGFGGFTSAIVVDNPDPSTPVVCHIDYFNNNGVLTGTSAGILIQPEGFHVEAATPLAGNFGSAVITVDSGPEIVGEVLTHTQCVFSECDTDTANGAIAGASCAQQLQVYQDLNELWGGPYTLTNTSSIDFHNGEAPFFTVVNPNSLSNTIRIDITVFDHATGIVTGPITWRTITIAPNGTHLEKSGPHIPPGQQPGLWDAFISTYLGGGPIPDFDVSVHIVSESGLPILGDSFMTDFFSDNAPNHLDASGERFDIASTMLANSPKFRLVNPDLSFQPGGIIRTPMAIFNAGPGATGNIRVEYFDRNGALVGSGVIPSLVPGRSARIQPGAFGYPAATVGYGWARFTACTPSARLVGWAAREIVTVLPPNTQFNKVYADGLVGNGGVEPGPGFAITDTSGSTWTRKVMPLVRTQLGFFWPGYTTFVNNSVPNIGRYRYQFFSPFGSPCTGAGNAFVGLRFAMTSTTLEDPLSICGGNQSGRVDHKGGRVEGIHVLGDPFEEFGIPGFALHIPPDIGVLPKDPVPIFPH
jgi:hypothetical protein